MRRLPTALVAALLLALLAACGGDDGASNSAFCETARELAEEEDDLEGDEVLEFLEDLGADAPEELDEQFELIEDLQAAAEDEDAEALADFDQDDVDDAVAEIEDRASEDCDVDLRVDLEVPEVAAPAPESTTTTAGGAAGGEFDELIALCEGGDLGACDELFFVTPIDSPEEAIALTCGGLVELGEVDGGTCEESLGDGGAAPADVGSFTGTVVLSDGQEFSFSGAVGCFAQPAADGSGRANNIEVFLIDDVEQVSLSINSSVGFEPNVEGQGFFADESSGGEILGLGPFSTAFSEVPEIGAPVQFGFAGLIEFDAGGSAEIDGNGDCFVEESEL